MYPDQIKEARHKLGLSASQLAVLLDTDAQTIRRMEQREDASTFRKPAPRMVRLIVAYLDGYRPKDWPQTRDVEERR
jgi:DNA-binding transcriptional regulator YiaG